MDDTSFRRRSGAERAAQPGVEGAVGAAGWERDPDEQHDARGAPSVRSIVKELLETAIFILLVFLIVRGVVQNFKIEGQSMEPSLHTGQYILVNKIVYFHFDLNAPLRILPGNADIPQKIIYPFHMPRRGEVVVFEYPRDMSKDYIKRVIGLPGDVVAVKSGQVFVNDVLLDESYLRGIETICRGEDACNDERPVTVPPGTVFVMGDNRNNSSDSREWGPLPLNGIIGKAWVSYWPRDYWGAIPAATYASQP